MTIDEAFFRVVRRHWLLILGCVVIACGVSVHLSANQPVLYEAVGRVQMGTELAASNVQADAMSERALGIATSPGVVGLALGKARVVHIPRQCEDHRDVDHQRRHQLLQPGRP